MVVLIAMLLFLADAAQVRLTLTGASHKTENEFYFPWVRKPT